MEFTAKTSEINAAVQHAAGGVPSNPAVPVRAGMHIDARDDSVIFTGSDGDITFTARTPVACGLPDSVVVPGKMLADVLRGLPEGDVRFSDDGAHLRIQYGKGMRSEFGIRIAEVPYPSNPEPAQFCGVLAGEDFASAVKRTSFAANKTAADPALTALLLQAGEEQLEILATDRFRLAHVACKWSPAGWDTPTALVPAKAAERFCRGISGDVYVGWNESTCTLQSGEHSMTARLLACEYPKWRSVFEAGHADVGVPLEEFADAVRRAQLACGEDSPVSLTFEQGSLLVEAQGGSGRASEMLDAGYDDARFTALFGVRYLLEGLNACGGECRVGFTGPLKPFYIYSGQDYRYMVLPRRQI